jgi:hypothetical protein
VRHELDHNPARNRASLPALAALGADRRRQPLGFPRLTRCNYAELRSTHHDYTRQSVRRAAIMRVLSRLSVIHRVAQTQLSAIPAAATLIQLAALTGQHRGNSAGLLAGNQAFRDKRSATRLTVEQALARVLDATEPWHTPQILRLREDVREE